MLLRKINITRLLILFPLLLLVLGSMAFTGYTEQKSNNQSELFFGKTKTSTKTASYFYYCKPAEAGCSNIYYYCSAGLQKQHDQLTKICFKNNRFLSLNHSFYIGCNQLKTIPSDSSDHPVI
jgi:hypothetical protein